jgi:hypothetical protein
VRPAPISIAALAVLAFAACSRDPAPASAPPPTAAPPAASAPAASTPVATSTSASVLPADPAREIVLGRCTICHDERYLAQQRLGVEGWQKTITKMQGFGAPVTAEDVPVIAAYLGKSFAASAPDPTPALVPKPASGLPP